MTTTTTHHAAAGKKGADARWGRITDPAERSAATEAATKARGRVAQVDARVTDLEERLARLEQLLAA
jgi:uncharacterized protein YceH (UPF0502 family)